MLPKMVVNINTLFIKIRLMTENASLKAVKIRSFCYVNYVLTANTTSIILHSMAKRLLEKVARHFLSLVFSTDIMCNICETKRTYLKSAQAISIEMLFVKCIVA